MAPMMMHLMPIAPSMVWCSDKRHDPPLFESLLPGIWGHACPTCGAVMVVTVLPRLKVQKAAAAVGPIG